MSDLAQKCTDEQVKAITTIDKNVSVSAGAGSGKTFVLVQRFMHIMEQGHSADSIVAITFTRKAANEMKSRLRRELQNKIDSMSTLDPKLLFWQEQLKNLERAQISTFDSLYGRILRENPVEAQIDPGFMTSEGFDLGEFERGLVKKYIYDNLQDEDIYNLIDVYGLSVVVDYFSENLIYDLQDIAEEDDLTAYYTAAEEKLAELAEDKEQEIYRLAKLVADVRKECAGPSGVAKLQQLSDGLATGTITVERVLECIKGQIFRKDSAKNPLDGPTVQKIDETKALIKKIKKLAEFIHELDGLMRDETIIFPLIQSFHAVIKKLHVYLQEQKNQAEMFGFADIQTRAIDLLTHSEEVRHKYQNRFRFIMVDEFQDTNDKQRQLVYWLCGDDCQALQGTKLFIVGDAKQSIYRFRGAEVSVFARVRRDIKNTGGVNLELSNNFRSLDKVLNACNRTFIPLMGTDETGDVWFEALHAKKDKKDEIPVPTLLQVLKNEDDDRSKFEIEADAVVEHIQYLHDTENVSYDKVAILLNAMTHVGELQQALQKYQIPYQVVDGRDFFKQQEVLDLLNILTVLQNKYNNMALAGVLRSPYFGLDDTTITKLFLQNHKASLWEKLCDAVLTPIEGLKQQTLVERAHSMLTSLQKDAALMALPELWETIWNKLHVDAVLSRQQYAENKLANAMKLREDCLDYAISRQLSLQNWLDYVTRLRNSKEGEKINMANLNDVPSAVTIMTIHKSKGLEFNTVFVPFLSSVGSKGNTDSILYVKGIGLGIQVPDEEGDMAETAVYRLAKEMDVQKDTEERIRKLYVAMTRPEERLILSGLTGEVDTSKELADLDWMQQLESIFAEPVPDVKLIEKIVVEPKPTKAGDTSDDKQDVSMQFDDAMLAAMEPLESYVDDGQKKFTPSALQTYEHCERAYFYQEIMGLPPCEVLENEVQEGELQEETLSGRQNSFGIPALVVGLIAHRTMELYYGNLQAAFNQAWEEQKRVSNELRDANQKQIDAIYKMMKKYVESPLYQDLPAVDKQMREISIRFDLPNGLQIKGIIDFLAENDDGTLMIVDYKTGQTPVAPDFNLGYAYQLALYKMAVEAIYGKPVTKAVLHYLQDSIEWQLPMDSTAADYHDFTQEALDLCMTIHKKGREENHFACNGEYCNKCEYSYICTNPKEM